VLARHIAAKARPDVEVRWIYLDFDAFEGFPRNSPMSAIVFARLFVPDLMPPNVRKLVYLDADLVVQRDLADLLRLDLAGAPLAAVRDLGIGSKAIGHERRAYFNAGMLVVDTAAYREAAIKERALTYSTSGSEIPYAEQDCLNAVVDSWLELDYSWNFLMGHLRFDRTGSWISRNEMSRLYAEVKRGPVILHFTAFSKPWSPVQTGPGSFTWVRWLTRSGWFSAPALLDWLGHWIYRSLIVHLRLRLGTMRLQWRTALRNRVRKHGT
jgi:lipopolysaccharide biosynthesis glycosyltransferase